MGPVRLSDHNPEGDGSLSDILLPFKLLEEPSLVQQLLPTSPVSHQRKQFSHNTPLQQHPIAPTVSIVDSVPSPLASRASPRSVNASRRPPMLKRMPSKRNNHIYTERKRRQDMACLFDKLRSVLPDMKQHDLKVDRCTMVGDVIEYVQELEKKVQELEKMKEELLLTQSKEQTNEPRCSALEGGGRPPPIISPDAATSISVRSYGSTDISITLNCPRQRGFWPNLLALLQDTLHLHVYNVVLSCTPLFCVHSIYAKVVGNENSELYCDKLRKSLSDFVAAENSCIG